MCTAELAGPLDVRRHVRSGLIAQDLLVLGMRPLRIATLSQRRIAPFHHAGEALGWLYVVERGRRHDMIRRHPELQLPEVAAWPRPDGTS